VELANTLTRSETFFSKKCLFQDIATNYKEIVSILSYVLSVSIQEFLSKPAPVASSDIRTHLS